MNYFNHHPVWYLLTITILVAGRIIIVKIQANRDIKIAEIENDKISRKPEKKLLKKLLYRINSIF